jgi:hypothetical protein
MTTAVSRNRQALVTLIGIGLPAVLLVCSSLAKAYVLFRAPAAKLLVFGSYPITVALVCAEIMLASWLISGKLRKLAIAVSIILFSIFSVFSLQKGIAGESSCSCFGMLETSPWLSMSLDILAIGCLVAAGARNEMGTAAFSLWAIPGIGLVSSATICLLLYFLGPTDFETSAPNTGNRLVVIEPEKWVGKPFPLSSFVDRGEELDEGKWKVIFLVRDCDLCHAIAKAQPEAISGTRVAFLEVPPYRLEKAGVNKQGHWFRLNQSMDWFVEAPVSVSLTNGIVTSVADRTELEKWKNRNDGVHGSIRR